MELTNRTRNTLLIDTHTHMYTGMHAYTHTIGLVITAPNSVKREENPKGVQMDIKRTPNIDTKE